MKTGIDVTLVTPSLMPIINMSFYKPDGALCYSIEMAVTGETTRALWKNAAGATVATGTVDASTMSGTVMCTGRRETLRSRVCRTGQRA